MQTCKWIDNLVHKKATNLYHHIISPLSAKLQKFSFATINFENLKEIEMSRQLPEVYRPPLLPSHAKAPDISILHPQGVQ